MTRPAPGSLEIWRGATRLDEERSLQSGARGGQLVEPKEVIWRTGGRLEAGEWEGVGSGGQLAGD
jgi:hypothetical protein